IGFAFALEQGAHIRVTFLTGRCSEKVQQYALLVAYLVGFIVIGGLGWQLVLAAIHSVELKQYTAGLLPVPIYPSKVIFTFAVLLFSLGFLL
ncbi:unnamed protein product, partial [marine sediment metagenome]